MLKREITYENFDGEMVTEVHHFHFAKNELIDLEVEYEGGLQAGLQRIIDAKDYKALIKEFKKLVLLSYGIKSEDGKRFIKNDELREEFSQTIAYDTLFMELATDDTKAAEFIIGILPKDVTDMTPAELLEQAAAKMPQEEATTPTLPPPSA